MTAELPSIEGYDILRELGRGAMGVVYLARDRFLEREVAIKVIGDGELTMDALERFLREARAMARLSHPNVVTVYRAGVANNAPFLVMELLRGRSLDVVLEKDGVLSPAHLLKVAIDTTRGLAAAHARGVIHRDIKPSNLFETEEHTIKVLDFGIAKLAQTPDSPETVPVAIESTRITAQSILPPGSPTTSQPAIAPVDPVAFEQTLASSPDAAEGIALAQTRPSEGSQRSGEGTQVSGTALYMAPEVWRAEGADSASDVWSLGATLYMLATGHAPFRGRSVAEIAFHVLTAQECEPLTPKRSDLEAPIVALIERCLAKNRATRFGGAQEVLAELERISRSERSERAVRTDSPYPGLRSMTATDRDHFFGRDDDIARIIERLRGESLVVLVGASGTGKSSLAAAGIAPLIAEGVLGEAKSWRVVRVSPGRSPIATLASALSSTLALDVDELSADLLKHPDALVRSVRSAVQRDQLGVLLLIDQLEELVTQSAGDERDAIAAGLARLVEVAPRGVRVIATARSDLFDRLGSLGTLGTRLGRATELVRSLQGATLRDAIVEPARNAGFAFEDPAILDSIIAEVGDGQQALPLLAFALRAWWERRDQTQRLLTTKAWESLGGVAGALGSHSDAVFESLTAAEHTVAQAVMVRLVADDGTRRYATRDELIASASGNETAVDRVLTAFSQARLLNTEGVGETATWTITHESLFRAWPRLRAWLDSGREDHALHQQLSEAARAWDSAGRRPELLWRGAILSELARWREVYDDTMSQQERQFADSSALRHLRRTRALALAGAAAVLALGLFGARQAQLASKSRDEISVLKQTINRASTLARNEAGFRALAAAQAMRDEDPTSALAWTASAARALGEATLSIRALAIGVADQGVAMRVRCTSNVAVRENGTAVACAQDDRILRISLSDGPVQRLDALQSVRSLALAQDTETLWWIDAAQQLVRWDEVSGRRRIAGEISANSSIDTDASGELGLLVDGAHNQLRLYESGAAAREPRVVLDPLWEGKLVGEISVWVVHRSVALLQLKGPTDCKLRRVSLERGMTNGSPWLTVRRWHREQQLVLWDDGTSVRALNLLSGVEQPATAEQEQQLNSFAPTDPDEPALIAHTSDLQLRREVSGEINIEGHAAMAGPVGNPSQAIVQSVIEPQGRRVALVDESNTLSIYASSSLDWSQATWLEDSIGAADRARSAQSGRIVTSSLDGHRVAVAAVGLGAFVVDVPSARVVWSHREPRTVAVAAGASTLLLGLSDGAGVLVLPDTQQIQRGTLLERGAPVTVAISSDGRYVAAAPRVGDARWLRVTSGGWTSMGYRSFSELSSPTALALAGTRLTAAARWLGVVQAGGITTLAHAPSAFFDSQVHWLRFSTAPNSIAADRRGTLWLNLCEDDRCTVEWLGTGDVPVPIANASAIALQDGLGVSLHERGRVTATPVLAPGRLRALEGVSHEQCALSVDVESLTITGPASRPIVLQLQWPPDDVTAFVRWVAHRTNVRVAQSGELVVDPLPAVLP